MDNDKQKSAENSASPRPGIFSTPDLTVDTEKLAQAVPSADSNKSRIASVFANTDATRQAQQSTITSAPLEGDIVLNGAPKKRSKVPIIVLAIAAALIIALIVIFSILKNTSAPASPSISAQEAFHEYYELVTRGPKDYDRESTNEWFLYALQDEDLLDAQEKTEYVNELIQYVELANQKINVASYDKNLKAIVYTIMPEVFSAKLTELYSETGAQSALQFVEEIRSNEGEASSMLSALNWGFNQYAMAQIQIYDFYESYGCIKDGLDVDCINEHTDNSGTWSDLRKKKDTYYNYIVSVLPKSEEEFTSQTDKLLDTVGGNNE